MTSFAGLFFLWIAAAIAPAQEGTPTHVLLLPNSFSKAPAGIRERLSKLGCLIPQNNPSYDRRFAEPHNLVRGQFAQSGQWDWSVLCTVKGQLSLRVLWGGRMRCSDTIRSYGAVPWDDQIGRASCRERV